MFGHFFVDGQHFPFRFVGDLHISMHSRTTCLRGNQLAVLHDLHQLIIVPFDGGLTWSYLIGKSCGFNIIDHRIYDADHFLVICYSGQYLNCYACIHLLSSSKKRICHMTDAYIALNTIIQRFLLLSM